MEPANVLSMREVSLNNKRVLIRADLNVPIHQGAVTNDARIQASLASLEYALEQNAAVVVMSHLGRPSEGQMDEQYTLAPVAQRLSELLQRKIPLITKIADCAEVRPGSIAMLENVRYFKGEKANEDTLAQILANQCDVFVMDAFGTAHRAHASTHGIAKFAPIACAGLLLQAELSALGTALANPQSPMVAIVGGSKVSTKLEVLDSLANIADQIITGGGIANTFIAAAGYQVGQSLYEKDLLDTAREIAVKIDIPLPSDVMVGKAFAASETAVVRAISEVAEDEMILDIGPITARQWGDQLQSARTILWNGPLGVFEFDQFGEGTRVLAEAIAMSDAFSIAGGGDTLAAIDKYGVRQGISYISTGGGAFLEFVEGKVLPAVDILRVDILPADIQQEPKSQKPR